MAREIKIGNRMMGDGHPAYIIAEIGINHNGDLGHRQEDDRCRRPCGRGCGQVPEAHA